MLYAGSENWYTEYERGLTQYDVISIVLIKSIVLGSEFELKSSKFSR